MIYFWVTIKTEFHLIILNYDLNILDDWKFNSPFQLIFDSFHFDWSESIHNFMEFIGFI